MNDNADQLMKSNTEVGGSSFIAAMELNVWLSEG